VPRRTHWFLARRVFVRIPDDRCSSRDSRSSPDEDRLRSLTPDSRWRQARECCSPHLDHVRVGPTRLIHLSPGRLESTLRHTSPRTLITARGAASSTRHESSPADVATSRPCCSTSRCSGYTRRQGRSGIVEVTTSGSRPSSLECKARRAVKTVPTSRGSADSRSLGGGCSRSRSGRSFSSRAGCCRTASRIVG